MLDLLVAGILHASASAASVPTGTPAHSQVIVVRTSSPSASVGTLEAFAWRKGAFHRVLGPMRAYVGSEGIGAGSEWHSRTPAGVYSLTEGFGWGSNPGTRMPYQKIGNAAWWVSDVNSSLYNTMQFCTAAACPFDTGASEHLASVSVYRHAVVIDYNRSPIRSGAGSAFFLHESADTPTAGCVAIGADALTRVMQWLRPGANPVISIGVGSRAYRPVAPRA